LISGALALSHWWQRQRDLNVHRAVRELLQLIHALALVGVLFFWLQPQFAPSAWLVFLNGLAITLTIYGAATRAWTLAAAAQLFLLVSSIEFVRQLTEQKPQWSLALIPIATLLLLSLATTIWLSRQKISDAISRPLLGISTLYRAVAFAMTVWWVFAYVAAANQFWCFILVSYGVLAVAGVWRNREALIYSTLFAVFGLGCWWFAWAFQRHVVSWPNALAVISMILLPQLLRRHPARWKLPGHADTALLLVSGCTLWAFVSRWTVLLFAAGFALRERVHRWMGLGFSHSLSRACSYLACGSSKRFIES